MVIRHPRAGLRAATLAALIALPGGLPAAPIQAPPDVSNTAPTPASPPLRQVRMGVVDASGPLPADLTAPAGRSRWDLTSLSPSDRVLITLKELDGDVLLARDELDRPGLGPARVRLVDPGGGDAALRWQYPDRFPLLLQPGARAALELEDAESGERLFLTVATIGIGWLHLPSGPRETVLQQARILRGPAAGRRLEPGGELYRWVDPRAGVVAQIRWPGGPGAAMPDGDEPAPPEILILEEILAGAADLKIYVDQIDRLPLTSITYGYNRGSGTAISSLVPQAPATMGDLVALDAWDFSANTASVVIASHVAPAITPAETCNATECGYTIPGVGLDREDFLNLLDPNDVRFTHNVTQTEVRPGAMPPDTTIWLRAGTQNEGRTGSLGTGESRLCYYSEGGVTRSPVPLFRFSNQDAQGYFMQVGDPRWTGGPFTCQPNVFNEVCGTPPSGQPGTLYVSGSPSANCSRTGTQYTDVVKAGVLTTPSGHTFNALLLRSVADFCLYLGSSCLGFLKVDEARTVNYLWMVPHLGTTVRLQSPQISSSGCPGGSNPDLCYTTVAVTDIKFGLFPPRSITVTGTTDTTLDLSWDPGLITSRIDGYRLYWDTDSGATGPYAFDSDSNPSQVSFSGTSATLSGLTPGTTYHVTVTSRSTFTNPKSGVVTSYESLLFPTQISGDPAFVYPVEVQAATTGGTCIPTAEVSNLTVESLPGGETRFCWDPSTDPCLTGYQVLGSATADSDAGFAPVGATGGATCWTGTPADGFFLAVAEGTGGTGPWGHYGR